MEEAGKWRRERGVKQRCNTQRLLGDVVGCKEAGAMLFQGAD